MKTELEKIQEKEKQIKELISKMNEKKFKEIKEQTKDKKVRMLRINYDAMKEVKKYMESSTFAREIMNLDTGSRETVTIDGKKMSLIYLSKGLEDSLMREDKKTIYIGGLELEAMFFEVVNKIEAFKLTINETEDIKRMINRMLKGESSSNTDYLTEQGIRIFLSLKERTLSDALLVKLKNKVIGKALEVSYEDRRFASRFSMRAGEILIRGEEKETIIKDKTQISKKLMELTKEVVCAE